MNNPNNQNYCPACNATDIAEILTGIIDLEKYAAELSEGSAIYAGENLWDDGPHWLCKECKTAWCKNSTRLYRLDEFGDYILTKEDDQDG